MPASSTRRVVVLGLSAAPILLGAGGPSGHSQGRGRPHRLAVLMDLPAQHALSAFRMAALKDRLQELGRTGEQDLVVDVRWSANTRERGEAMARELLEAKPDIFIASSLPAVLAVRSLAAEIPLVFTSIADPVELGIVASLARPGGTATGFTVFDYSLVGKWFELLREIAPRARIAGVIHDPSVASGLGQIAAAEAVAPALGLTVVSISLRDSAKLSEAIGRIARDGAGGLILTGSPLAAQHQDVIVRLAAEHRLPAVYIYEHYVTAGGLISYGPDLVQPFRQAADYVDRILKGEPPGHLPVQAPTHYRMAVNLKTARALGLTIPNAILLRADEVIE